MKSPVAAILKSALKRKQTVQPGYSLRAFARDLGVSPAFASNMMAGKKLPPKNRLAKLVYCLELDILEREKLVRAVRLDEYSQKVLGRRKKPLPNVKGRKITDAPNAHLLASWLNLAVLEGLTLEDPSDLRQRLGASQSDFQKSIAILSEAEIIEQRQGRWVKKDPHLYLSGGRSRREVRAFHEMMIQKAREELTKKTSQEHYERRLINGFTLALNPGKLESLKVKILEFMDELSQEAAAGECTEVYQLNFQFFPLTSQAPKK